MFGSTKSNDVETSTLTLMAKIIIMKMLGEFEISFDEMLTAKTCKNDFYGCNCLTSQATGSSNGTNLHPTAEQVFGTLNGW